MRVGDLWETNGYKPPNPKNKSTKILNQLFDPRNGDPFEGHRPHEIMGRVMRLITDYPGGLNNSTRGNVFEIAVEMLFQKYEILPYTKACTIPLVAASKVDFVFLLQGDNFPLGFQITALTLKMSLAERWRQMSFEAEGIERVFGKQHRIYGIGGDSPTKSKDGAKETRDMEEKRELLSPCVDGYMACTSLEFSKLISDLHKVRKSLINNATLPLFGKHGTTKAQAF